MLFEFMQGALIGLIAQQFILPLVGRLMRRPTKQHSSSALFGFGFAVLLLAVNAFYTHKWDSVGFWTVGAIYELWQWWDSDDNQWRRKQQAKSRRHVRLRTFTPSPIPAPGGNL